MNSDGSVHCICTENFQGKFCTQRIATPTIGPSNWIFGPEEIAQILAGVLGLIILTVAIIVISKHYCRKVKAHKPVAKEDPDLLSKSEFSKSVGVGTQGLPPIELNILSNGHHNHLNHDPLDPGKPTITPEFITFNTNIVQKQRGAIVCSVAPNFPITAPSSNSDNESIIKSTWAGEKMGLLDLLSLSLLSAVLLPFQMMSCSCEMHVVVHLLQEVSFLVVVVLCRDPKESGRGSTKTGEGNKENQWLKLGFRTKVIHQRLHRYTCCMPIWDSTLVE